MRSIWDLNLPLTENRLITQLVVTKKDQEEQKIFQTTTGQHPTCAIWNMNKDSMELDQGYNNVISGRRKVTMNTLSGEIFMINQN